MTDTKIPHILLVEDEEHLAMGLIMNFELEEYAVSHVATAREADVLLTQPHRYDAIVLDIMLPDMDGTELCRRIRTAGDYTPIIMLTALGSKEERVVGLDAGADDYLPKPFDLQELLARLRSLLRRSNWIEPPSDEDAELRFGKAVVNFTTRITTVDGIQTELTALEYDLLQFFRTNANRALPREEILAAVWGLAPNTQTRSVDNFVMRLRRHFEDDPANPRHFLAIRGVGYKFVLACG